MKPDNEIQTRLTGQSTRRSSSSSLRTLVRNLIPRETNLKGLLILWLVLLVGFSLAMPEVFLRGSTVQAMMYQIPELGILTLAMAIPLISGGLNLAIIATTNQAALLMAGILLYFLPAEASGVELWGIMALALVAGFLLCLVIGVVTGLIVAVVGIHPILVTLGTMTLINGLSIYFTRGRTLSGFPEPLLAIANNTLAGIPISFYIFIVLALGVHLLLIATPLGVRIHMLGSNLDATRFSGVDHRRVLISVYALSSLLCWAAAIVTMGRFNSAGG